MHREGGYALTDMEKLYGIEYPRTWEGDISKDITGGIYYPIRAVKRGWLHGCTVRLMNEEGDVAGYVISDMDGANLRIDYKRHSIAYLANMDWEDNPYTPSEDDLKRCIGRFAALEFALNEDMHENQYLCRLQSLPCEFFNHELLEVDPDDEESLHAFIQDWGLPYSPYRFTHGLFDDLNSRKAIKKTIALRDSFSLTTYQFAISIEEAREAITLLQDAVGRMFRRIVETASAKDKTSPKYFDPDTFNFCAANDYSVIIGNRDTFNTRISTQEYPSFNSWVTTPSGGCLTSAICNQILTTLRSPEPWKLCACKGCGRLFKEQHTQIKEGSHAVAVKHPGRSSYCSDRCSDKQKSRDWRDREKNRIDHGI